MLQDRYGLSLSTSSEAAASAYRDGIDLMLAAWPGAERALDAAIAADPGFALAHAGRARTHYLYADGRAAKAKTATARELVAHNGSDREKAMLRYWHSAWRAAAGDFDRQDPQALTRAIPARARDLDQLGAIQATQA
jgi:hypothetical protein